EGVFTLGDNGPTVVQFGEVGDEIEIDAHRAVALDQDIAIVDHTTHTDVVQVDTHHISAGGLDAALVDQPLGYGVVNVVAGLAREKPAQILGCNLDTLRASALDLDAAVVVQGSVDLRGLHPKAERLRT